MTGLIRRRAGRTGAAVLSNITPVCWNRTLRRRSTRSDRSVAALVTGSIPVTACLLARTARRLSMFAPMLTLACYVCRLADECPVGVGRHFQGKARRSVKGCRVCAGEV